ncbi:MAG: sigma 54-interacting transcriptional regulator [bacterium]|nr:sigma 54-interacting transcriptional regulator [bacterium]
MTANKMRILLVEDNHQHRQMLKEILYGKCEVDCAIHYTQAKDKLKRNQYELVLLDLMLPQRDGSPVLEDGSLGLSLLRLIRDTEPLLPVVVISALQNTSTTLQILKLGIADFIVKDELEEQLPVVLKRADLIRHGRVDNLLLRHYQHSDHNSKFVFADKTMKKIDELISIYSNNSSSVLILGESGTGKEVIAREIHERSSRCNDPFIDINCGAIPEHLLESELFGHEKGAFTGADRMKSGLIELAQNGTLFLDEIADLSLVTQVKLLRFLQERTFRRIGGAKILAVDVRIIAATNKDIGKEIAAGRFRDDLYYRLSGVVLQVPPLRSRKSDVPVLVKSFLQQSHKGSEIEIDSKIMKQLQRYDWPGNVRELQSVIQRFVVMSNGKAINSKLLTAMLAKPNSDAHHEVSDADKVEIDNLMVLEKAAIIRVLATSLNQKVAAQRLGVAVSTLRRKMRDHLLVKTAKKNKSLSTHVRTEQISETRTTGIPQLLLQFKKGQSFTTREAMERLGGISRKHATTILNRLIEAGRVKRVSKGLYRFI